MRKVLRCDHCSHNEEEHDAEKMALHEKKCSFDPDNRSCWTCKHRYDEYGSNYCEIGLPQINDWMKSDGELCKGWEEDYDEENETDEQRGARLARKNRYRHVSAVGTLDKPRLKHKRCLCLLSVIHCWQQYF